MPRAPNSSLQTHTVLHALLQTHPTWKYGYDLSRVTHLKSGTLYPILRRLHEQGLLSARWEESPIEGRPPRHIYQLTETGQALASSVQVSPPAAEPARTSGKRVPALPSILQHIFFPSHIQFSRGAQP